MQVQLVVSVDCPPCRIAEAVWGRTCADQGIACERVDLGSRDGRQLCEALELRTVPAVVINGKLVAVGVQTVEEVLALLREHAGT